MRLLRAHPLLAARYMTILAATLSVATAALGSDDGGSRSVFAMGAGNRALGMGGAFCAVADDASAVLWNPGGLGLVTRKQFLGTQTTLFGLGFNEQFAALVVPHHRAGTLSFTFRRFAVDGIEQRDDRAALLADDLSDSETELAVGFGRPLANGLSVGAAVKLQRQSLAGFSDSALGLDVGLIGSPLRLLGLRDDSGGLTCGIAVRNLIEPSLRLDVDSTPDPLAWRGGLAYRGRLGEHLAMGASVDLERTRLMDARTHAGGEVVIFDILALRAGSMDGTLTAGAGLHRGIVGFDYQFEDNQLGQIHRFGLALEFGPTIEESRRAAQLKAATKLQTELDSAFAARTRNQAEKVVARARAVLAAGQWDQALELAGSLRVLSPDDPATPQLLADAWRGRGEQEEAGGDLTAAAVSYGRGLAEVPTDDALRTSLERVHNLIGERTDRSREMRQRFDAALDALARDELLEARDGFESIVAAEPGDQEATAMVARTRDLIAHRSAAFLEEAAALIGDDRLDDATARIADARALVPDDPQLAVLVRRVEERRAAIARQAAAVAARSGVPATTASPVSAAAAPLSEARQREIADLYQRGTRALAAGRSEDAIRFWEMVWSADPAYPGVVDHLTQEYLTLGMDSFAGGDPAKAAGFWEQALRVSPRDPRAQGYLERAREQLATMQRLRAAR